jgi:hypothetical protein
MIQNQAVGSCGSEEQTLKLHKGHGIYWQLKQLADSEVAVSYIDLTDRNNLSQVYCHCLHNLREPRRLTDIWAPNISYYLLHGYFHLSYELHGKSNSAKILILLLSFSDFIEENKLYLNN